VQGFLNPGLALLALAAGVPLLIHLLNRRRHRPLEWGAMRFLLQAYQRTRRKAQLENLLLLLLRMAVPVLLAFALARPYARGAGPLAALSEARRDLALVLDLSASTGYRSQLESSHERILARARELLGELDGGRGDRVLLVAAGAQANVLARRTPEEALGVLGAIEGPEDGDCDLAGALGALERELEERSGPGASEALELRFLTDMQARPWREASGWTEALDALQARGLELVVEDLGPAAATPPNLGIGALEPRTRWLAAGLPIDFAVRVDNRGETAAAAVRVALYAGGERRASQAIDVPPRSSRELSFQLSFAQPAEQVVEARLEGDALAIDDARAHVLVVPGPTRVLLVTGARDAQLERDPLGMLEAVLRPLQEDGSSAAATGLTPFATSVRSLVELNAQEIELADYDAIWIANAENLAPRTIERLEERVAAGAGLVLSLGERVDLAGWNARLWRADGSGLLPARLRRVLAVPDRRAGYFRVARFDATHPALAFFDDELWRPLLTEVPIYAFVASELAPQAHALAQLDDEAGSPLLVQRAYDRGQVLLWTSTIDPSWARVADSPRTLVPLVHELVRAAGAPRTRPRNVALGGALEAEFDSFPREPRALAPDGSERALALEPRALGPALWQLPPWLGAERVGVWRIATATGAPRAFAVQFDADEGELARLAPGELRALHPAVRPHEARARETALASVETSGEWWRALAFAALACVLLDALWAAWLGRRRR